ncbi:MAG: radical SAM protein [Candidatus Woesearchaeota archaeon]
MVFKKTLVYTIPSDKNFARIGRCGGSSKGGEKWPPVKLITIAGVARTYSNTWFLDGDNEGIKEKEFKKRFIEIRPDLAISEPLPTLLEKEIETLDEIKKVYDFKVVFIGSFASAEAENILKKYQNVDYIIEGEPETALIKLYANETRIKGVWKRKGKEISYYGKEKLLEDLDKLPLPTHDLLKPVYRAPFVKNRLFTVVESSRGCPYPCTFCNAGLMNGKKVRYKSPKRIVEELKFIKSVGINEVIFNDETFALNRKRTIELMKRITGEKLNLKWVCSSRVDTIDDEVIWLMKKAGCRTILFGVESGCQEILDYYKKGIKLEQIENAFKLAHKYNIETVAHFMFGAPMESAETIRRTVEFAKKVNPTLVSFNILTPYPGTKIFEDFNRRKLILTREWSALDQSQATVIETEHLSNDELEKYMKWAYKKFYYRPKYALERISRIKSIYDLKKTIVGFWALLKITRG